MIAPNHRIEPLGERALLLRFGETIDIATNQQVHAAAQTIADAGLVGIEDIVPAYATLAVHYDPLAWLACMEDGAHAPDERTELPWQRFSGRLEAVLGGASDPPQVARRHVEIAVRYGGEYGPDLDAVAHHAGLSTDEVAARHVAGEYTVAMLGFAPGFAYLLGLDAALHMPRRADPRTQVPAGSVAIGGAQTGIYPCELPGGWQLIGRTEDVLFDPYRSPPNQLAPGDRVRFVAVD